MKLEKINDHQIRCTLSKSDLSDREIKLSELAYGTDKAQELFKDMMEQASFEFGFDADNVPLMIEAIPLSADSIMLIITKVDDPNDLDAKFANLTSNIKKFKKKQAKEGTDNSEPLEMKDKDKKFLVKSDKHLLIYSFNNLDDVSLLSKQLELLYTGINSLYKNDKSKRFYLVIHKSDFDKSNFTTISAILSEYGTKETSTYATEAYYKEHFSIIIKNNALQTLSKIS
ncbi:MAG: adaptor protein MecA [Eubacteriales bacterium]